MEINKIYNYFLKSERIEIDTRKINGDCIYFAIKGERFDGNDFVLEALDKGASFAVSEREFNDDRIIVVENSLKTLQELARYHRRQFDIPFIAITGSNGKTTTKELLASILGCKHRVYFTQGNFNNHIGVPLTLLSLKQDAEMAIIEMGANKLGDIKELCDITEPTHGMITNVGYAHLDGFGSFENVKKGKAELYDFLCESGIVFLNSQEEFLPDLICTGQKLVSWTMNQVGTADYQYECIHQIPVILKYHLGEKEFIVDTCLNGFHNYKNVISAISIGLFFDVSMNKIKSSLAAFLPTSNRAEVVKKKGITFVLDAYNANPTSMKASLLSFSNTPTKEKVVVLGDMMELGEFSEESHIEILMYAIKLGFSEILTVGKQFENVSKIEYHIKSFSTIDDLKRGKFALKWKGNTVLLKGSRAMKLEALLDNL